MQVVILLPFVQQFSSNNEATGTHHNGDACKSPCYSLLRVSRGDRWLCICGPNTVRPCIDKLALIFATNNGALRP